VAADSAAAVVAVDSAAAVVAVDSAAAVAAAVVAVAGSECPCQQGISARRHPNGRRAPALPSVKSHNGQGLHTPGGAINFKADGVALEGSEGAVVALPVEEAACPNPYKLDANHG
jgi:hypothetical protein